MTSTLHNKGVKHGFDVEDDKAAVIVPRAIQSARDLLKHDKVMLPGNIHLYDLLSQSGLVKADNAGRCVRKIKISGKYGPVVVGLYLNPPDQALVLCVDEKSQIQALDRTQPGLPLKKGRCGTMTHDYKRKGTTTLFAALQVLNGKVIGECHGRHRHQEWRKFLRRLDAEFPPELKLHLVMDNYGTHQEPHVQAWLKKHPRFVCHFVPTSSSWLNLVERWFRELTEKAIRRGSFGSVPDLNRAIEAFLQAWNQNPKPFIWSNFAC